MLEINNALEPRTLKADVLLVTATDIESRAVLHVFEEEAGHKYVRRYIGDKTYFELGDINGASIMMVQSEMGTNGPGDSLHIVDEGIRTLSPSSVIMVGIAFGMNQNKQKIGDIVVSRSLLRYELQKETTDTQGRLEIIQRGNVPQASTRLVDRFRSALLDWQGPNVTFGLVLSGTKLVDNQDFRDQLSQFAPEAIGGEMEGAGLYSAAQRRKVGWILVKAICDWVDSNKQTDKRVQQQLAAENAVRFTLHVLKQGGVVTDSAGILLRVYNGHSSYVIAVDWEPDGSRIASAGGDGVIHVWDAETGQPVQTYRGHPWQFAKVNWPPTIYSVKWSPTEPRLASVGDGSKVFVWHATTGQTLTLYQGHSGRIPIIFDLAWSPDGTLIASACSSVGWDKTIHIWNASTGELVRRLDASYGFINFSVLTVAWSPNSDYIAAACGDQTVRIWDTHIGRCLSTYRIRPRRVVHLAWSPDSQSLALAFDNHTAELWDALSGKSIVKYHGHVDDLRYIAWSPSGASLATASNDKTVQLWDAKTGERIYTYRGHTDWVTSVTWSPDETRIASASNDKTVQVWRVM